MGLKFTEIAMRQTNAMSINMCVRVAGLNYINFKRILVVKNSSEFHHCKFYIVKLCILSKVLQFMSRIKTVRYARFSAQIKEFL